MRTIIYNLHFVRALTCLFERSYNKILIKNPGNFKRKILRLLSTVPYNTTVHVTRL